MEKEGEPRLYEIVYLLQADDEPAALDRAASISEAVEKEHGIIAGQTQLSRKILNYLINGASEGWWGCLKFMARAENIAAIQEKIKKSGKILRFALFKADRLEAAERPRRKRIIKQPPADKTSIAEIDKKLEEILGK